VMAATAIVALCLIPVMVFQQRTFIESKYTQQEIAARLVLIDFCEWFRNCPYDRLKKVQAGLKSDPHFLDKYEYLMPTRPPDTEKSKLTLLSFLKNVARTIDIKPNYGGEKGLHLVTFEVSFIRTGGSKEVPRSLWLERLVHEHVPDDQI
jgi:hypothetical protein